MKAKIEIRIWSDDEQPSTEDLVEMFRPHVEHVADMLDQDYWLTGRNDGARK